MNRYREALALRSEPGLGLGSMASYENPELPQVLAVRTGGTIPVLDRGSAPVPVPAGKPPSFSSPQGKDLADKGLLGAGSAAWLRAVEEQPTSVRLFKHHEPSFSFSGKRGFHRGLAPLRFKRGGKPVEHGAFGLLYLSRTMSRACSST